MATFTSNLAAALYDDDEITPVFRRVGPPKATPSGLAVVTLMKPKEPANANLLHDAGSQSPQATAKS